jgi:hypothetical protein
MGATVKLSLKPLMVPNFVGVQLSSRSKSSDGLGEYTVPVSELDEDALEDLAYGFLLDFYKKAGKHCPFYRPVKAEAYNA